MTRRLTPLVAVALALVALPAVAAAQADADGARGRQLFAAKQCARCHRVGGARGDAPSLETLRRPQGTFELAGRMWNHAPAMFTAVGRQGIAWPSIDVSEMEGLMAYLRADAARDPAPNLAEGQGILVRKGCLKCHQLDGEGGRIGPDLAHAGTAYGSAAAWASRMWQHTPRMAVKALELGVLYPRFDGDEMGNLVGFLRSAAR